MFLMWFTFLDMAGVCTLVTIMVHIMMFVVQTLETSQRMSIVYQH